MLVYLFAIPGGMLADKVLGQKKAVMLGAIILVLGHGTLAIDAGWAFFSGLGLIILGVGCFKNQIFQQWSVDFIKKEIFVEIKDLVSSILV